MRPSVAETTDPLGGILILSMKTLRCAWEDTACESNSRKIGQSPETTDAITAAAGYGQHVQNPKVHGRPNLKGNATNLTIALLLERGKEMVRDTGFEPVTSCV